MVLLLFWGGVRLTIKHEKELEEQKVENMKPRLKVKNMIERKGDSWGTPNGCCHILSIDVEKINDDNLYNNISNNNNYESIEYELENIGLTEINQIFIVSTNPKKVLKEFERIKNSIDESSLMRGALFEKRYIKPGETIKLQIFFEKEDGNASLSFPSVVWLYDVNGRYWKQNFLVGTSKIEISERGGDIEFKKDMNFDVK